MATTVEQINLRGEELADEVKRLVHEGNVRHLVVKHEGHTVLEVPVNLGLAGVVLAPAIAAVAAVGAVLAHCTLEVVRTEVPATDGGAPVPPPVAEPPG